MHNLVSAVQFSCDDNAYDNVRRYHDSKKNGTR